MTPDHSPSGTQVRHEGGAPSLVSHRLRLRAVDGASNGREWDVSGTQLLIGSAPGCDVTLEDPAVSRRHCEIVVRETDYLLRDLESTNGTFLDDTQIVEAPLPPGGRVRIGDTVLVFQPKKKWVRLPESEQTSFGALVGGSSSMRSLFGALARIAPTRLSCVLLGETGTGKELAARALHAADTRRGAPFVVVDCAAVSRTLIETELFGHEQGAFTGAVRSRTGAFEHADGGTLFLDEIGELPTELQPKLLRALERREIKRLGATLPVEVDVRVVCATHRPLETMVSRGEFREDLYYRLAEVVLEIPPLRERAEDIPALVRALLDDELKHGYAGGFTDDAMATLQAHPWPGNVRELRNVIRRALVLSESGRIGAAEVRSVMRAPPHPASSAREPEPSPRAPIDPCASPLKAAREQALAAFERDYLEQLLRTHGADLGAAAAAAGVHVKTLQRLLRQYNLRQS